MKGIILAGGRGTRLFPMTLVTSKQLLPIYDKPMVYYPLTILMLAGIREILLISTPRDLPSFKELLDDGKRWGISISYAEQPQPAGLAQAYIIGAEFLDGAHSTLILGDNLFFGHGLADLVRNAGTRAKGATIFVHPVSEPSRYGVIEFDRSGRPISLEEKPMHPRSNWAVTGLYCYDFRAVEIAKGLKPSNRGELEITDLNRAYLELDELFAERLGRGYAWLDTGTPDTLSQAAEFVRVLEKRQGLRIACPEEVAYRMGYISRADLICLAEQFSTSDYGNYLLSIARDESDGSAPRE
jgi:glucose-1-phosphate thymidylyltransferase